MDARLIRASARKKVGPVGWTGPRGTVQRGSWTVEDRMSCGRNQTGSNGPVTCDHLLARHHNTTSCSPTEPHAHIFFATLRIEEIDHRTNSQDGRLAFFSDLTPRVTRPSRIATRLERKHSQPPTRPAGHHRRSRRPLEGRNRHGPTFDNLRAPDPKPHRPWSTHVITARSSPARTSRNIRRAADQQTRRQHQSPVASSS